MGLEGLQFRRVEIPLAAGLQTKTDPRALQAPGLSICRDVDFDELGGLETRKPLATVGSANVLGGGTLTNIRRVFARGDELCCFTDTGLYSWDARDSAWVLRGTHLAVATAEATRFATIDDQIDPDRAELSNVIVYTWSNGTDSYLAAVDKTNGAVIASPTKIASVLRPRLVACQTRILWFGVSASNLVGLAIDPANVATSFAASPTTIAGGGLTVYYDVTQLIGSDAVVGAIRRSVTTVYSAIKVTAALAVTLVSPSRTCDGPIAVSCTPDGAHVQIVRGNGTAIQGDLLSTSTLADVFTAQAIGTADGTPVNQIAAAHRSVQDGGQYRCYAFWSSLENTGNANGFTVTSNWVDTGNAHGTAAAIVGWCGVGSRAFDYNGRVYVWATFGQTSGLGSGAANVSATGQFQNAYYLYRDDGFLAAKAVYGRGGGLAPSTGRLPGVALTAGSTTFSWCANVRRVVTVGQGTTTGAKAPASATTGYSQRSPRDVTFTFDSADARRVVKLGNTVYVATGEGLLQYDGTQLLEVGYHVFPWYFDAIVSGPGSMANGTFGYKSTFRHQNGEGEIDRSSTATVANATVTGSPTGLSIETVPCPITHRSSVAVEIWRTPVNPPDDAPYYLITSQDPAATSNPNRYLAAAPGGGFNATVQDAESDATAGVNPTSPDNDGTLPSLPAPPASIVIASENRIYVAGVAGYPDSIWYSKQRNDGEVAAFNGLLVASVPPGGGKMTGLLLLEGELVALRERAIYSLPGDGFANDGEGSNFGPSRILSSDVGLTNPDAIGVGPFGAILKTAKGWYALGRDFSLQYVGAPVAAFDGDTVLAVHVVENAHEVRILTNARMLVWDYNVDEWTERTISDGVHATLWKGSYVYASATSVNVEQADYSAGTGYGMDVETAFWKPDGMQGRMVVRSLEILGEFRSACALRVRLARDYQQDGAGNWSYYDDDVWIATPTTVGSALQVRVGPSQKRCEAIKVRITAINVDGNASHAPTGEAIKLTGIAFDVGFEDGPYNQLPAGQKI